MGRGAEFIPSNYQILTGGSNLEPSGGVGVNADSGRGESLFIQ